MKNIKLVFGALTLGIVLLPSVAFASWWNPFTWFPHKTAVPVTVTVPVVVPQAPVQAKKPVLKPVVVNPQPKPAPVVVAPPAPAPAPTAPVVTVNTPAQDLAELQDFLTVAISDLKNLQKETHALNEKVLNDRNEFSNAISEDIYHQMSGILSDGGMLYNNISVQITDLYNEKAKANAVNVSDLKYWKTTGVKQTAIDTASYTKQLVDMTKTYSDLLISIKDSIPPTPPPAPVDPAQVYKDCSNAEDTATKEVLDSFKGFGGGSPSYVRAMIQKKMKEDGFGYCFYLK